MKTNPNKNPTDKDHPIALILGRYSTTGIGVARCLGRLQIPVQWIDSKPKQVSFTSRYCQGILSPDPIHNEQKYIDFLTTIGEQLTHKGVLFPIADTELLTVLHYKHILEKYYRFTQTDLQQSEILLNKQKFYQTLKKQGIPHPKTIFLDKDTKIQSLDADIQYPCILKPIYSDPFRRTFNTKLFLAQSKKQLKEAYQKIITHNQRFIIQEKIPGDASCMCGLNAYYDKRFQPHGVFMYQRIREWPPVYGNGCLIKRVLLPELEKIISPLMKTIRYYGIADAEFKKDPRNGQLNLIEINPRCWMQVSLPNRCGINIPYLAYADALGKKLEANNTHEDNSKWVFLLQDITLSLKKLKKGELSMGNWIRSYRGKKEYAIFAWDDPLPAFQGFFHLGKQL